MALHLRFNPCSPNSSLALFQAFPHPPEKSIMDCEKLRRIWNPDALTAMHQQSTERARLIHDSKTGLALAEVEGENPEGLGLSGSCA